MGAASASAEAAGCWLLPDEGGPGTKERRAGTVTWFRYRLYLSYAATNKRDFQSNIVSMKPLESGIPSPAAQLARTECFVPCPFSREGSRDLGSASPLASLATLGCLEVSGLGPGAESGEHRTHGCTAAARRIRQGHRQERLAPALTVTIALHCNYADVEEELKTAFGGF